MRDTSHSQPQSPLLLGAILQATVSFQSCDMESVPRRCRFLRCYIGEGEMECRPDCYRLFMDQTQTGFGIDCHLAGQQANRKIIQSQRESRGRVRRWVKPLSGLRPVSMKFCVCFSCLSFCVVLFALGSVQSVC